LALKKTFQNRAGFENSINSTVFCSRKTTSAPSFLLLHHFGFFQKRKNLDFKSIKLLKLSYSRISAALVGKCQRFGKTDFGCHLGYLRHFNFKKFLDKSYFSYFNISIQPNIYINKFNFEVHSSHYFSDRPKIMPDMLQKTNTKQKHSSHNSRSRVIVSEFTNDNPART
jgi:hypothetical protein